MQDWTEIDPVSFLDQSLVDSNHYNSWLLVLRAKAIPFKVNRGFSKPQIFVPAHYHEIAESEIQSYEVENQNWNPSPEPIQAWKVGYTLTLLVVFSLALLHTLQGFGLSGFGHMVIPWRKVGAADAARILDGEWWRTITALMLHGGAGHIIGNLVIGGFFAQWLTRDLGGGLAWMLILLSGAGGNLINAIVQSSSHISIGASTAVFGTMGILCGIRIRFDKFGVSSFSRLRDIVIPIGVGLVLLGFLGVGGERTDVGAHIFGMLAGFAIGIVVGNLIRSRGYPKWWHQAIYGLVAIAVPVIAWAVAFSLRG